MMQIILTGILLALVLTAQGATKYVPADDSQPLIRRDQIPLDIDAIRELADQLAILADGPAPRSAAQMRHRTQTLTLSQRLDPTQARAREIEKALRKNLSRPRAELQDLKAARRHVLDSAGWLAKLPPETEGYLLGQLLLDILEPIAVKDPVLEHRNAAGAPARWKGVVAKVVDFELQNRPDRPKKPDRPKPQEQDEGKFAVTALLTEVPMFSQGVEEGSKTTTGLISTSLVITSAEPRTITDPDSGEEKTITRGDLRFQPAPDFNIKPLHLALRNFFAQNGQALPKKFNLNINTNKRRYLSRNRENIAAPLAMMLDAAISGRPLRRNTILFARLRADGSLEKPIGAWELLLKLEQLKLAPSTRLIVGKDMMEEMNALLVLEKAAFFTQFEVLVAPTFDEARKLFYDDGNPDPDLAAAMAGYEEVREKAVQATNLATFLGLSAVESRLLAASNNSPNHLSAKMLATQAVRRPAYFSRYMFAQELDRQLEDLANFEYQIDQTPERAIKDTYKQTRENLEPLRRRIERQEEDILDEALLILKGLNTIGRDASAILDNEEIIRKRDMDAFQKKLATFREKLRLIYLPPEKK